MIFEIFVIWDYFFSYLEGDSVKAQKALWIFLGNEQARLSYVGLLLGLGSFKLTFLSFLSSLSESESLCLPFFLSWREHRKPNLTARANSNHVSPMWSINHWKHEDSFRSVPIPLLSIAVEDLLSIAAWRLVIADWSSNLLINLFCKLPLQDENPVSTGVKTARMPSAKSRVP